jgi:hypothetical protein
MIVPMDVVLHILLFVHFIGLASLLGGYLTQLTSKDWRVVTAMVHGALTQLVTGVAMVGILAATHDPDEPVDNAKYAVKLVVLLVILGLVWANRSKERAPHGAFQAIGLLTVVNIAVAVFWR